MAWSLLDSGVAGFVDGNTPGHVYTFPLGAATAGNLLVLEVASDTVVATPTGWLAAVSDVHNIGAYIFYRAAAGGETAVTVVTSGNFPTEVGFLRYSGNAASPLDVVAAGFATVNGSTTPAATTAALTGTGELAVAAACLGGMGGGVPSAPSWSAGYTNRLDGQTSGTGTTDTHLFVADNRTAGTAAQSPSCSWTSNVNNQTLLVATFKPAGGQTLAVGQAAETDTARPIGRAKTRTVGVAVETDQARPLGRTKRRPLGVATVVETAQPIGRRKTRPIAPAVEVAAARPVTRIKTRRVGTALEVDTARHVAVPQVTVHELPDLTATVTYMGRIDGAVTMTHLTATVQ